MQLSSTEWKVMHALWQRSPATAREILGAVDEETHWAYTTVRTLLARLVEKGAVAEHKQANTSIYEPILAREDARKDAVQSLLDRVFDGTAGSLVQHLIRERKLSKKDRAALARMLEEDSAR